MADEKELMKKDLSLIIQIDSKMRYNDIQNVQKIHDAITQKNMFQTNLGKRYVNKLKQIIQGQNPGNCIFCGKGVTNPNNTVMCEECSSKFIKKPTNTAQTTPQNASSRQATISYKKGMEIKDKVLQKASTLADNTKNKIQSADIKSQAQNIGRNISENENLQRSKEYVKEMTQDIKKSMHKNNNSTADNASTSQQSAKRKKIVIIGIVALIVIIAIISAIGLETIFSIATIVSLGYLIYTCVKKKPKKKAIIVFVVCILLTGIASEFLSGLTSNDYADYLGYSEKQITKKFGEPKEIFGNEAWKFYKYMGITFVIDSNDGVSSISFSSGAPSSANTQGLQLGDNVQKITNLSKKGWEITSRQYKSQTIYLLSKSGKKYAIKVFTDGTIVTAIDILSSN